MPPMKFTDLRLLSMVYNSVALSRMMRICVSLSVTFKNEAHVEVLYMATNMYIYKYIYIYTSLYIYVCIYAHTYIYVYIYICIYMYTLMYTHLYIYRYIHM